MNKFQEFKMVAEAFMSEADLKTTAQLCLKTNPKSYAEFERVFIDLATSRGFIEKGMLTIVKKPKRLKSVSPLQQLSMSVGSLVELINEHESEPKYIKLCYDDVVRNLEKVKVLYVP